MDRKTKTIRQILNGEYLMYQKVPTEYPNQGLEPEAGFRLTRGSVFETWSQETLDAYAKHIGEAMSSGRNLMTEKYARMDDLIPPPNTNPIIDSIVKIEADWQSDLRRRYPHFLARRRGEYFDDSKETEAFVRYLKSELETYSDETLESYFRDISTAQEQGINLAERKYLNIVKQLGFDSLEAYEQKLSH